MLNNNEPLNPKDFSSYREYLDRLKMIEKFDEMVLKVNKAVNESKSDEEFNKKMEELGYDYHEDEYCENPWCQKNKECLMIALEVLQNGYNEDFFADLLAEKDLIITPEMMEGYDLDNGCSLPQKWHNCKSLEGKTIDFLFAADDALIFNNVLKLPFEKIKSKKEIKNFCRNLYLFAQAILYKKQIKKEWMEVIKNFLWKNSIISHDLARKLLKQFKGLR